MAVPEHRASTAAGAVGTVGQRLLPQIVQEPAGGPGQGRRLTPYGCVRYVPASSWLLSWLGSCLTRS